MRSMLWRGLKLLFKCVWLYFMRERAGGRRLTELASELHTSLKAQPWWQRWLG
jgi:hypothetical protein